MTAKKKPRKGTKQPASIVKSGWFVSIMICLALLLPFAGYRYYLYRQGAPLRKVTPQMQAIQQELSAKLPNVKHNELTKYCGKSSDVQDNGTVSCSIGTLIILEDISPTALQHIRSDILLTTKKNGLSLQKKEYSSTNPGIDTTMWSAQLDAHTLTCSLYDNYYTSLEQYANDTSSRVSYIAPVYTASLYCTDYPSVILPGYPRIH